MVFCRSGCGLTGVYIALDTLLQDLASDRPPDDVSVFDLVLQLRNERVRLIENEVKL